MPPPYSIAKPSSVMIEKVIRSAVANATEQDRAILMRYLGLDQPLPVQYLIYVKNIALGDFGNSVLTRRPVTEHIWERLPATVELGLCAMLLSVLIGVPLGISRQRRGCRGTAPPPERGAEPRPLPLGRVGGFLLVATPGGSLWRTRKV